MTLSDLGLIGLAVMGQNLVLNFHDHGYRVSVYNRTASKTKEFLEKKGQDTSIVPTYSLQEFVDSLQTPRKILLMVKAGDPVDLLIDQLLPLLDPQDILIDGGNSLFTDTNRRTEALEAHEILYLGVGISGGEEGARHGPSIMPGGNPKAWPVVQHMLQAVSAKAEDGVPCCDWVGSNGAGHFVKMVHNGIEYGDMQLICEAYHLLKSRAQVSNEQIASIFSQWNKTELDSYLIEITSHIFEKHEPDGSYLVDHILDVAGQKGTGKWTVQNALEQGSPLTLIAEAVFARFLSTLKQERQIASEAFPFAHTSATPPEYVETLRQALFAAKILSYTQGFMLMQQASQTYGWNLNYGNVAMMWRGGCIIRSQFLSKIKDAYANNPDLENLLFDSYFTQQLQSHHHSLRQVVADAALHGIPVPCLSAALAFFDGYRSQTLPQNLLQAQRDYFGAHTYERLDTPRGVFFHADWSPSSTVYHS